MENFSKLEKKLKLRYSVGNLNNLNFKNSNFSQFLKTLPFKLLVN